MMEKYNALLTLLLFAASPLSVTTWAFAATDDQCSGSSASPENQNGGQSAPESLTGFGLQISGNRKFPLYAIGEDIDLTIQVRHAAYITVVSVGADGQVSQIFPNQYQTDARLDPGKALKIPLKAVPPVGCDLVKVIASSTLPKPPSAEASRSLTTADTRFAGSPDWQEATLMIDIVQ